MVQNKPLNPEVEDCYEIISLPDKPESWCIKITEGLFEGVILSYGKVDLQKSGDKLISKIEHDILYVPERMKGKKYTAQQESEYKTLIGKIAMNILYENAGELKPSKDDPEKLVIEK